MKKSLFYWVFLVVAGISLTACSSDDSITDNNKPATPDSQNRTVILTGTIGIGDNEATRAVDNSGHMSWTEGEKILVQYRSGEVFKTAEGKLTNVDGHDATFTATLDSPTDDGLIAFAYPYVKINETDYNVTASTTEEAKFTFNYTPYSTQDGTTKGISDNNLDYACSKNAIHMKVDGTTGKATLKGNAELENQFCMYKFTIDNSKTANLLEIIIADGSNFTTPIKTYYVKPASAANVFYVALEPKETGDKVKVVASISDASAGAMKLDSEYKINQISASDYGKFICVDATDGNQAYLCTFANRETPTVCEHTYSTSTNFVKGKFYTASLGTSSKTLTPTAVIAHVGPITSQVVTTEPAADYTSVNAYCEHFLALALEDAYTTVKTLHNAYGDVSSWASEHGIKISGTTYNSVPSAVYDEVQECAQIGGDGDNKHKIKSSTAVTSASRTIPFTPGWRVPSVTDLRHIFHNLNVITIVTPINPIGIMDHSGQYYEGSSSVKYGNAAEPLYTYINNNLCKNNKMDGEFYWLSSEVQNTSGTTMTNKAWRFDFAADYFVWTEGSDNSLARLVFAY